MITKTSLCILGLLFLGMLCMPAAETKDSDYWSFYLVDAIYGSSEVNVNGHGYIDTFGKVNVSNSLDEVYVQFELHPGVVTTLTITKDYITRLREENPGQEPVLYAWGGIDTYDVDAGFLSPDYSQITIYEHLKTRGAVHHAVGEIIRVKYDPHPKALFILN